MTTATTSAPAKVAPHLFKSTIASCNYIFSNGNRAVFRQGMYMTSNAAEIAALNAEIAAGHPTFFVDPNEVTVSPDRADPIASLRARIAAEERARILAEMAAATDPSNNFGDYEPGKFKPGSTSDIAAVTHGGDATARLMAIKTQTTKINAAPAQAAE